MSAPFQPSPAGNGAKNSGPAITSEAFDASLDATGPFETTPHIAVAVSGGPDSLALLCLAVRWAERRDGRVTALTVNHGLRPDAAAEARQVGDWSAALGAGHCELVWRGPKPTTGVQAAARAARYRLLTGWCRDNGVAHLLLAHHADDQAETFLYRMSRGSGAAGLAAMPAVAVRDGVRLLRPLLSVRRAALAPVPVAAGLSAIDDPSNRDPRFARVAMREHLEALEKDGIGCTDVLAATAALGRLRADRDRGRAALAAAAMAVYPAGYAEIAVDPLREADAETAGDLVAATVSAIGGRSFAPRRRRLRDLVAALRGGSYPSARTLGGCVLSFAGSRIRIFREPRAIRHHLDLNDLAGPGPVGTPGFVRWDGRFDIRIDTDAVSRAGGYNLSRLGETGWQAIAGRTDRMTGDRLPGPVRFALPAVRRGDQVVEVPHLGFDTAPETPPVVHSAVFRPELEIAGAPFRVA